MASSNLNPRVRSVGDLEAKWPELAKAIGKSEFARLLRDVTPDCFSHEALAMIPAQFSAEGVDLFVMAEMWVDACGDSKSSVLGTQNLTSVLSKCHEQATNLSATTKVYRRKGAGAVAMVVSGKNGEDQTYATLYTHA